MIGLLQVDGKWPNLALIHLGGWLREQGEDVRRISYLQQAACSRVYAAKVFQDTSAAYVLPGVHRGGTGWADWRELPDLPEEAEHAYPAYDMWGCDKAMGYLTRGCIRKCPFCVVPTKEGRIHHHAHLSEWWRGQETIRLLDPNLTAHPDCLGYLGELAVSGAKVDVSQGVDARLITPEIARALRGLRYAKSLHTAWDRMRDETKVLRGMRLLREQFGPWCVMAYVLVGYETTPEEDMYRIEKLRELGISPFVMAYDRSDEYQRHVQRWVNHKAVFHSVPWAEYRYRKGLAMGTIRD